MANLNMYHDPPPPPDDISLLLREILFKSSSPASSTSKCDLQPPSSLPNGIPLSSSVDYDPDEYDTESEEGLGHLMAAKPDPPPPRNPSKRTRAAEVHNMSEKRRRSRINEKMKALQKLIPNSNKTDKASMLDEAIEYLKQLQLQVQVLTMRNGINLYSMCAPHGDGVLGPSGLNHSIQMTTNHGQLHMLSHNQPPVLNFSQSIPSFGSSYPS